jgi:hypothetical protein
MKMPEAVESFKFKNCGRVPNSIWAKRYSDFAPEKLGEIYDRGSLGVLMD